MDIHCLLIAAAAAVNCAGMIADFNPYSAVVTWSMLMCLFHTGRHLLELVICLLAGFVYHTPLSKLGLALYATSYTLFFAALPFRRLVVPPPIDTSVQVTIDGDDI